MYIWKISPLIEQLKSDKLSQKEQLKYFMTYSVLIILATDPLFYADIEYNIYDTINTVILCLLTIIGIIYCYKINQSVDDKDFILRFMTLGLPITTRIITTVAAIAIIDALFQLDFTEPLNIDGNRGFETTMVDVIITSVVIILYYAYFASKLKKFADS